MPFHCPRLLPLALVAASVAVPLLPNETAVAATTTAATLYAGGGFGDGGPALSALIGNRSRGQRHVAVDAAGNVYVPDAQAHAVRKVDATTGLITRFAGTGVDGFSGDGGPATAARLSSPVAVVVAPDGGFYVADRDGNRIRRIAPDGTITTFAGNGGAALSATTVPAASAAVTPTNLYVADDGAVYVTEPNDVRVIAGGMISPVAGDVNAAGLGGDGGPAVDALLHSPADVVRDANGVLYVADGNNRVRRVGTDGVITTVAGKGTLNFGGPNGNGGPALDAYLDGLTSVSLGSGGTVLIAEMGNGVRGFVPGGTIDVVAAMPCAGVVEPEPAGTFLVACDREIHRVAADGSTDAVIAGTAVNAVGDGLPATDAALTGVSGMAADADRTLYVTENGGGRVRAIDGNGVITTVAGTVGGASASSGDGGPATEAVLRAPRDLAVAPDGTLYIADTVEATVRAVTPGGTIDTVAGTGTPGSNGDSGPAGTVQLAGPLTLAATAAGIDIGEFGNQRVLHVTPEGTASRIAGGGALSGRAAEGQPATSLSIAPTGVARSATGDLLVLSGEWLYTIQDGLVQTAIRMGQPASRLGVDRTGRPLVQSFEKLIRLGTTTDEIVVPDHGLDDRGWAVLADGRIAYPERYGAETRVLVTTPAEPAPPAPVTDLWAELPSAPPVVHWTPPASWGDAVAIPIVRKGTVAARTPTDGYDVRYYPAGPNATLVLFDQDMAGLTYGEPYTVAVFSYSPSARAYSAPATLTFVPRVPPAPVTGLTVVPGLGRATLAWTNPAGTTGVDVRMAVGTTPPATATSGTSVFSGSGTTVTRTGLANGTAYSFAVFARNAVGDRSTAGTRTLRGSGLTARASATTVNLKGYVTVSGTLRATGGGALPGQALRLLGRVRGTTTWAERGTLHTTSTGTYQFVDHPAATTEYVVRYGGYGTYLGTQAGAGTVQVRTQVTATASRTSVPLGGSATIYGSVAPSHRGQTVRLQRWVNGMWQTVASATLSSASTYSFVRTPVAKGTYVYRVEKPADVDHAVSVSPSRSFVAT